jgi:hypothetical protein
VKGLGLASQQQLIWFSAVVRIFPDKWSDLFSNVRSDVISSKNYGTKCVASDDQSQ